MANKISPPLTYSEAGVDIDAGNALVDSIKPLVADTARPGADSAIGGFGGLFDLAAAGYRDPVLVAANDGVGTKLRLAIDTGIHDTVGIDLVAMCVNDLIVQGAEPLFFLDYLACNALDVHQARTVIAGIAEGCKQAGAALIGGETAEMPGMYASGDYDLAGFAVGAVERDAVLPRRDVKPGDTILGLASAGLHSNGFSLVRRIVDGSGLELAAPAPFDAGQALGQALLTPTRIYVRSLLAAMRANSRIKALAHITGGGILENVPRILPDAVCARIDLTSIPVPTVFSWLAAAGPVEPMEMLRTFNCGIGMVVIVDRRDAAEIGAILMDYGETVFELGTVAARDANPVELTGSLSFDGSM